MQNEMQVNIMNEPEVPKMFEVPAELPPAPAALLPPNRLPAGAWFEELALFVKKLIFNAR